MIKEEANFASYLNDLRKYEQLDRQESELFRLFEEQKEPVI